MRFLNLRMGAQGGSHSDDTSFLSSAQVCGQPRQRGVARRKLRYVERPIDFEHGVLRVYTGFGASASGVAFVYDVL